MAAKAFVLIETAVGKNREVLAALGKLKGTESVDTVTGPYGIIAVVQRETLSDLGDLVVSKIHTVDGVTRTVTCLVNGVWRRHRAS